ncbi:glycosyltransferase family 4 protein [Acidobacteriota bacterium]
MSDRPLKACIVVNTYPPQDISGVGELARELHAALPDYGIETTVLTRGRSQPGEKRVIRANLPKFIFPPLAPLLFLRTLISGRFDIVHLNESDGFAVGLFVRLLRIIGLSAAKIVVTFQVSYIQEYKAVRRLIVGDRIVGRPAWSELVFKWIRCPIHIVCGRITAGLSNRIIVPSSRTGREIAFDYKVDPQKIEVINNGVALETKAEEENGDGDLPLVVSKNKTTFIFVGRFRIRKGLQYAIEAFRLARQRKKDMQLILVGGGEQDRSLRRLVEKTGSEGEVYFAGRMKREDLFRLFKACHVFVMPSLYEGFPVAILEAMLYGMPICASRVSGIPEAVKHGETGLLHEVGNVEQLAGHMIDVAENKELREEMGKKGRSLAKEAFSRRKVAESYADSFKNLLQNRFLLLK